MPFVSICLQDFLYTMFGIRELVNTSISIKFSKVRLNIGNSTCVMSPQVSFLVPPSIVPGRMALLVTLFLMLVNISTSATAQAPKSDQINALQVSHRSCNTYISYRKKVGILGNL
jgi:hypothetical protein